MGAAEGGVRMERGNFGDGGLVPEHSVNCQLQSIIDGLTCTYLPALAFLRSTSPLTCF